MAEPKRIDIAEFRRVGYLQELNRRFLHPLGLALEVVVEDDGSERLGGVWDYRDDPEGIWYAGDVDAEKARRVAEEADRRRPAREAALGFWIEPEPGPEPARERKAKCGCYVEWRPSGPTVAGAGWVVSASFAFCRRRHEQGQYVTTADAPDGPEPA
jgi:hypothetical protein